MRAITKAIVILDQASGALRLDEMGTAVGEKLHRCIAFGVGVHASDDRRIGARRCGFAARDRQARAAKADETRHPFAD